jgi:hypothetical protein
MTVALSSVGATPRAWRRAAGFAAAVVAVAVLHGFALSMLGPQWFDPEGPPGSPEPMKVRSVALDAPATAVPAAPPARGAPPPRAAQPSLRKPAVSREPAASMPEPPGSTPAEAAALKSAEAASAPEAAPSVAPPRAPETAAVAVSVELPVYRTRMPAAGHWRYRMQRGLAVGEAELTWQPQSGGVYEMRLEGRVAGITVLDWVSRGALDGAGIAPERYAIRRRGQDRQAANFQRDANKITFSGPTYEMPLLPGVQDRLSWMLQLPAIVEAAPERFGPGARIVLMVVGARGGSDVWTFTVAGPDTVDGTPALKLLREAQRARDLRVEIWLDPARGHLPLKAVLAPTEGGAPLGLQLEP